MQPMPETQLEIHSLRMSSPRLARGRYSEIGACYSVTAVTLKRNPVFLFSPAAGLVVEELRKGTEREVVHHAWVVMRDHVHLLLQLRYGTLPVYMQRFKSLTARAIRTAAGTSGALWQPGYYDHRLRDGEDLASQVRYIVANPVRKGMVRDWRDYPYAWCRWPL